MPTQLVPDRGGGGRPRAPKGGRPMIRINLLAVEREAHARRRSPSFVTQQAHGRLHADPGRGRRCSSAGATGRSQQRIDAARHRHLRGAAGNAAAALDHPAGPAVRAAQGAAAAARRAHRAAARRARPVRCTCSIRSAGRCRRCCGSPSSSRTRRATSSIDGRCTTLTGLSDFVANLEGLGLLQAVGAKSSARQTETDPAARSAS